MNPAAVEEVNDPCPACGVSGWLWICAATGRAGCQACGECARIRIDAGEGAASG